MDYADRSLAVAERDSPFDQVVSWSALSLLLLVCTGFAWVVPQYISHSVRLFRDFGTAMHAPMVTLAAIPTAVIIAVPVLMGTMGVVAQIACRSKKSACLLHLLLTLTMLVLFIASRTVIDDTSTQIIQAVTGP